MPRGLFPTHLPRGGPSSRAAGWLLLPLLLVAGGAPTALVGQIRAGSPPGATTPLRGTSPAAETPTGLWWAVGVGVGSLRFTCDLCTPGRDSGPSLFGQVGAWAGPAARVALEGGGWTRDDGGVRETLYRAGLTGFYHPDPDRGLHLLAGLAWVGHRADDTRYDAAAVSVGLGWDLRLLPGWTVGNAVRIDAASFGAVRIDDDRVADDVGLSLIRFEVTVGRRTRPLPGSF